MTTSRNAREETSLSSTPGTGVVLTMADVVRLLRPRGATGPVPAPEDVRQLLGDGPLAWIREASQDSTDLVARLNPELVDYDWESLNRSNDSSLIELLVELAGGRLSLRGLDGPRTVTVHEVLANGVELPRVLTTMRAVQRLWTAALLDHATTVGASPTMLRELAVTIARGVDSVLHAWTRTYPAEFERLANTRAARRWRLIDELLTDPELVDPDVARQLLAIEPDDHHLCVVVGTFAAEPGDKAPLLAAGVATVETALLGPTSRGRRVVVHERDSDELWIWVSGPQAPTASALRGMPVLAGLRVGVGGLHPGAAGFRRSTLEAREAARLALRPTAGTPVLHEDVALVGLLSRDPERAGWFVEACLGPLASGDNQAGVLRETLCAFYTSGMRPADTAAALHLHRNTLVNRLHRVEALLGHGVTYRATEMYCALLLLDVYPDLAGDRPPER